MVGFHAAKVGGAPARGEVHWEPQTIPLPADVVQRFDNKVLAVTGMEFDIVRSGGILQEAVRRVCPGAGTAKILVQRDEETALPNLLYSKLPPGIGEKNVVLCDPMLVTRRAGVKAATTRRR